METPALDTARYSVVGPRVDVYGMSDRGRTRERNEDQFLIADLNRSMVVRQTTLELPPARRAAHGAQGKLLVVADGLGGHAHGDVASAVAVEALVDFVLEGMPWVSRPDAPSHDDEADDDDVQAQFRQAMAHSEARVRTAARTTSRERRMATTLTAALLTGDRVHVAHAGDSRCYLYQHGRLVCLTRDHTVSELMRGEGAASQAVPAYQHVLYNAVGADDRNVVVELHRRRVARGDMVLLCTDGITRHLRDEAIAAQLSLGGGAIACCEALVNAALVAGGEDNLTVVLACL